MIAELAAAAVLWAVPPPPSPMPAVHYEACPVVAAELEAACYLSGGGEPDEVYVHHRSDLQHELGHAYDHRNLNDGERAAIAAALRFGEWDEERFANWYDGCRRAADPRSVYEEWIYYPFRSLKRIARRCALIARAGL